MYIETLYFHYMKMIYAMSAICYISIHCAGQPVGFDVKTKSLFRRLRCFATSTFARGEVRVLCPGSLRIANFRQVFVREIQPAEFVVYKVALEDRVDS